MSSKESSLAFCTTAQFFAEVFQSLEYERREGMYERERDARHVRSNSDFWKEHNSEITFFSYFSLFSILASSWDSSSYILDKSESVCDGRFSSMERRSASTISKWEREKELREESKLQSTAPCFPSRIRFWSCWVRSISCSCSLSFFSFSSSVLSFQKQIWASDPPLTISYNRNHYRWNGFEIIFRETSPSAARERAHILSSCFSNAATTSPVLSAHTLWVFISRREGRKDMMGKEGWRSDK